MQFVPEDEDQAALRKLARDVAERDLAPRAAQWDEPEAGSAVNLMRAHLLEDPDGGYRLNAYKNYVTAGHVAGACLVWCRWPGGQGAKGIGAVIVDLSREGV